MKYDRYPDEIYALEIGFENCECITVNRNAIGDIHISQIHDVISRRAINSIGKFSAADEVFLEIFSQGNIEGSFLFSDEYTPFQRLTMFKDITSLTFVFGDGRRECYLVEYGDNDEEENSLEDICVSDFAVAYIVIGKKKLRDFVDLSEINDRSYFEFQSKMLDIGEVEEPWHDWRDDDLPDFYKYILVECYPAMQKDESDAVQPSATAVFVPDECGKGRLIFESAESAFCAVCRWKYYKSQDAEMIDCHCSNAGNSTYGFRKDFALSEIKAKYPKNHED